MEILAVLGVILLGCFLLGVPVIVILLVNAFNFLKNLEHLLQELRKNQMEQSLVLDRIRRHITAQETPPLPSPVPGPAPSAATPAGTPSPIAETKSAGTKEISAPISVLPEKKIQTVFPESKTASAPERKPELSDRFSDFTRKTEEAIGRIVRWLCVGEEFRNPNVSPEYAVATTWLVRVGVLILLCGVAFFLKYSIDNNLVKPEIRIAASFLFGAGMVWGGLRALKGRYQGVASGIIGAGFVTCYLSVYFAYRTFSLIPYGYSFAVLLAVVAAAGILAIWKNQLLPAVIGTLGGYAVPILLSRGSMDLPGLFTFASLLSVFVLLGAAIRSWRILHLLAFSFNALIYLAAGLKVGFSNYRLCIFFFCVNFAIFSVIPLVCRLFRRMSITLIEVLLLLFNYLLFLGLALSAALYYVSDKDFASYLMLGTTLFTGAQYALLYFMKKEERALSSVLAVMTGGSLVLFVCLRLSGNWMNVALAVLAVAMAYAGMRTADKALGILSWGVHMLLGIHVFLYSSEMIYTYPQLALDRFFSLGIFALALGLSGLFLRRSDPEKFPEAGKVSLVFLTLAGIQFFYYTSTEIYDLAAAFLPVFKNGILSVYWSVCALALLLSGLLGRLKPLRKTALALFIVCALKIFLVDLENLGTLPRVAAFLAIGVVMILGAVLYARFKERFEAAGEVRNP